MTEKGSLKKKISEKNRKAIRAQEKKSLNKESFDKGGKKNLKKKRQIKQNKGRKKQELQKGNKERDKKRKKRKKTLSWKKKRNQWKQEKKKKQEKEWDGLLQRMTRGRCPCHCDHRTNKISMKDEKKRRKPGGAKYFLEGSTMFFPTKIAKRKISEKKKCKKFVPFFEIKDHENSKKSFLFLDRVIDHPFGLLHFAELPQFLNTPNWENLSLHHTLQCTESVAPRLFSVHPFEPHHVQNNHRFSVRAHLSLPHFIISW